MDVSASSSLAPAAPPAAKPADARMKLQIAMLKKALDAQQESAAVLLRETEGKGQVLDIRA